MGGETMKNRLFRFLGISLGSLLILSLNSPLSRADACSLPVCDIPAKISELKTQSQNDRYNFITLLRNQYKKESQRDALENLKQFGLEAKKLFIEVNEEKWLVREAALLVDDSAEKIAKLVPDFLVISDNFSLLSAEEARYRVIKYWCDQVETFEDSKTLNELLLFADFALKLTTKLQDSEYVSNQATVLLNALTQQYTIVTPIHEGVYQITFKEPVLDILPNRLTLIATFQYDGLIAAFSSSTNGNVQFLFKNVVTLNGLKVLTATLNTPTGSMSMDAQLDPESGVIFGKIESAQLGTMNFLGQRIISPANVPNSEVAIAKLPARLNAMLGNVSGILRLREIRPGAYSAFFVSNDVIPIRIDFSGKFFPKKGILTLSRNSGLGVYLKLVMSKRTDGLWQGFGYSALGGNRFTLVMTETQDLEGVLLP